MSITTITKKLRDAVIERANDRCEYCLMPAALALYTLQIDHIIPEKQRGPTISANLALACKPCNVNKGSSVVRYYFDSEKAVLLFNPRKESWDEHFTLGNTGLIHGLTDTGLATIDILELNLPARIDFRKRLIIDFDL